MAEPGRTVDERRTAVIRRRYNRNAIFYDVMDRAIREEWRRSVVGQAFGRALEVGVGTGKNLPYYDPTRVTELTAIDFSPAMLARARRRAHLCPVPVTLLEMDAQRMGFPDHTFDSAVATCVFCSVPDPLLGLQEIRRVLRPGGLAFFLEHVRIDAPVIGTLMDLLNPISVGLTGVNINRRTVENVRRAGFEIVKEENVSGRLVKRITARA